MCVLESPDLTSGPTVGPFHREHETAPGAQCPKGTAEAVTQVSSCSRVEGPGWGHPALGLQHHRGGCRFVLGLSRAQLG